MRSPLRPVVPALVFALAAAACDSAPWEPPAAFPFASATPECGPADGPAVSIYLTSDARLELPPAGAYVRIYVWHGRDELDDQPWAVGGSSSDGMAAYEDSSSTETQLAGTVTVTGIRADGTIEGEVDLRSAGAFAVRGGFRARWIPRTLLCG